MTNYSQNSAEAYESIKPHLNQMQEAVYNAIHFKGQATMNEIASILGKSINTITPRINELMYNKQVIKVVKVIQVDKRPRNVYGIRFKDDAKNIKEKTWKEKCQEWEAKYNELINAGSQEVSENEAIEKNCLTCQSYLCKEYNEPCISCVGYSKWTAI